MDDNNVLNEQITEEAKFDPNINLKSIKDVTLNNGKRIIIMFKDNSDEPTVISIDPKLNLVEEVKKRQEDYTKYQGLNAIYNTENILNDLGKESNSYEEIRPIDDKNIDFIYQKYKLDKEKLKILTSLLKRADKQNVELPNDQKFAYIDINNDCIISMTGKVLEAEYDSLKNEVIVESPETANEYRDEELDGESLEEKTTKDDELKDEDFSDEEIENIYHEEFYVQGVPDNRREEIINNLKKISKDPTYIDNIPMAERDFYYNAMNRMESMKNTKTQSLEKEKALVYNLKPNKKKKQTEDAEAGKSSYLYIALVVLLIAFAIFMYIIFRR